MSGGLGIGGGVVITPLLLSSGQPPSVASVTSVYIIFFSTLSSFIQFMCLGTLNYQYALFNGGFVLVGSLLGLWLIGKWVRRSNKQSILVFLLCFMSFLGAAAIATTHAFKAESQIDEGINIWKFDEICPS